MKVLIKNSLFILISFLIPFDFFWFLLIFPSSFPPYGVILVLHSLYLPLTGQTNILKKCLIMKEVDESSEKYGFVSFNLLTGVKSY